MDCFLPIQHPQDSFFQGRASLHYMRGSRNSISQNLLFFMVLASSCSIRRNSGNLEGQKGERVLILLVES